MSSDRNDGISIAWGIRKTARRYRYLSGVIDGKRSPSLLLGREVQSQRNWPDSWIRRVARSESPPTLIEREGASSSINDICMSLCK